MSTESVKNPDEETQDQSRTDDLTEVPIEFVDEQANSAEESSATLLTEDSLRKEVNELNDRLVRKVAEFENYKRRQRTEVENLYKYGAENFITKLLPVMDDFERSLAHIENATDINAVREGVKLIYDKFMKVLNEQGVAKIEALGEVFDVNLHEALMQQTVSNAAPHTVVAEMQSGYWFKDKVIRHTQVIVADENSGAQNQIDEAK